MGVHLMPPGAVLPDKPEQPNAADNLLVVSAPFTLMEHRPRLLELFNHFCAANTASSGLPISGWLTFLDVFDICPWYISTERCEDAFNAGSKAASGSAALAFGDFQEALCHLAKAMTEKQWKVEYAAEKAGRYRYKHKDADKSRVVPGPEERLEALLIGALELHDPAAFRRRVGIPPAIPAPTRAAASATSAFGVFAADEPGLPSVADLDAQMRALRNTLAADDAAMPTGGIEHGASGLASGCAGSAGANGSWSSNGGASASGARGAASAPPSAGAGRNSRRAAPKKPPGNSSTASPTPYGVRQDSPRPGGGGGGFNPAPPGGGPAAPPGSSSSPRSAGVGGGRSPRRYRVANDQTAASHLARMGITPSPPTTPRSATPTRSGQQQSAGPGGNACGARGASAAGSAWESSSVFISPRPVETTLEVASNQDGAGAATTVVRNKENRTSSSGITSGGSGASRTATVGGASTAASGADASPPSQGAAGRVRLRESTNTRGYSASVNAVAAVPAGAALGCQVHSAAPPASQCQYYQLSSRGGAAQPLTDVDFVQQLLGASPAPAAGASAGGTRKRSSTSAGGQRSAAAVYAGTTAKDAVSKGRPNAFTRGGPQRGSVQAW